MIFDFGVVWAYKEILLSGLLITLELSALIIAFGTIIGIFLAICKTSENHIIRRISSIYSDFFRTMPFLVMLIWVYYALPIATGIRIGAFETAVIVLSLHLSAYVAELIRSGIEAIPTGQIEAAKMLGLSRLQTMRRIVLPQVFMQLFAPLTGLYIEQIKNTTFASVIAVNELLHSGQILISQTYRPLEIYTAVALLFMIVLVPLAIISKRFEFSAFVKKIEAHQK